MTLITNSQNIRIDDITEITISDIVADEDSGGYVRKVNFFTEPLNQANRTPVLVVMVYGPQLNLEVQTPTLKF
jgi:hypothetical protein